MLTIATKVRWFLLLFLYITAARGEKTTNMSTSTELPLSTPVPSPKEYCNDVFHDISVVFTNPRAGKISGFTLQFTSDVVFNVTDKIYLNLPGFSRLGGSSGHEFMYTAGTSPGSTGGSVSQGQVGDFGIACFTGAQWDDATELLTLTQLTSPAVPAGEPITVVISPQANLILPGLLANEQSGLRLQRPNAPPSECPWTAVQRVQAVPRTSALCRPKILRARAEAFLDTRKQQALPNPKNEDPPP